MFEQMKKANLIIEVDDADAIATRAILDEQRIKIINEYSSKRHIGGHVNLDGSIVKHDKSPGNLEYSHGFIIRTYNYQTNELIPKLYQFIVLGCKGYLKVKAL